MKAMVFPIVMDGCKSWTIMKAEARRIDAFELWCWRRLLRVPWTARRSNQSILKEISPEYSLEGLMLKLKLQYFGHWCEEMTHLKRPWCWERLKVGGDGDDRGWDGWMASPTQWTWVWVSAGSWWWTGRPGVLQSMGLQRVGHNWVTELNWDYLRAIETNSIMNIIHSSIELKNVFIRCLKIKELDIHVKGDIMYIIWIFNLGKFWILRSVLSFYITHNSGEYR